MTAIFSSTNYSPSLASLRKQGKLYEEFSIKWFEEFVSKSNIIQTQEDISVSGKIAGNIQQKLCDFFDGFS